MIRISTIFVAICMVVIAAALGTTLYRVGGLRPLDAVIVSLTALMFLFLYNAVSMRIRDRADASNQIGDLARGTADLARQVGEIGRRMAAVETALKVNQAEVGEQIGPLLGEINELGSLVREIAGSVAAHEDMLNAQAEASLAASRQAGIPPPQPPPVAVTAAAPAPASAPVTVPTPASPAPPVPTAAFGTIKSAVEDNRIDLFLQPLVTLPQRKVRYYEAVSRLRDASEQPISATEFIPLAEQAGLMARIDQMVLFRCVQVLRRLLVRNKDVGLFCNLSVATLRDPAVFAQCLEFLDANRALAPSLVLEFKQAPFRQLGPVESEHLGALAQRGFRFSIDNVTDLRIEPRELADRGVRFIKVPAHLLLDADRIGTAEIHPADLSDLLGRFGIDLVAERIEGERAVVDLLDYDVRYGQGFLFAPPRPLRPDAAPPAVPDKTLSTPLAKDDTGKAPAEPAPARTGIAALVRRVAGSN